MAALNEQEVAELRTLADEFLRTRGIGKLGRSLGAGASAAVFELAKDTKESRALKVYKPDLFSGAGGAAERRRLKLQEKLVGHQCANLVQLHGVHFDESTCLVEMELAPGVDLNTVLRDVPRPAIQALVHQLVAAVRFLESKELVHRDIKPQNIRVTSDLKNLKLLDLGVVREFDNDSGPDATAQGLRKPFVATAQYSSPEYLFWLHQPSKELWHALSLYQVGAVLHDLLMKRPLFADEVAMDNRYALAMAVLQKVPDTHADDAPAWLCALAARCLTKDMNRRLAMVSWDDFDNAADRTSRIAQRFQRTREHGIGPTDDALLRHKRVLRREQIVISLEEKLYESVRSTFAPCQLERKTEGQSCVLTLRLPNTELLIDLIISFQWSELAPDEAAAVLTHSRIRPESVAFELLNGVVDTCTVTESTVDAAVDALLGRLIENVGQGLDVAELNGGTLSAAETLHREQS